MEIDRILQKFGLLSSSGCPFSSSRLFLLLFLGLSVGDRLVVAVVFVPNLGLEPPPPSSIEG